MKPSEKPLPTPPAPEVAATGSTAIGAADRTLDLNMFMPFLLNRAGTSVAAAFSVPLKERGLTITTWRLLASLYHHGTQRIGELADFTSIELWTVSRMPARLEAEGLLRRERVGGDARTVHASLTEAGRALVEALLPTARAYERQALKGFKAEEITNLQQMLHKIYHNMNEKKT